MTKYETQTLDIKVVILGAASVGKTSIIFRYCNGVFQPGTLPTIGAGFFTHNLVIGKKDVNLLLWDTAGEERFKAVTPSLLHGANAMILVCDVTSRESLNELNEYYEMFLDACDVKPDEELPILVFGNKTDKDDKVVEEHEIVNWCSKNKIPFHAMCSAKTGENINEPILQLVEAILKPNKVSPNPGLQIKPYPDDKKGVCC